jgi:hypothetical protein
MHLESVPLAPATVNLRQAAVRRLAYEASDSGLLSPELVAGRSLGLTCGLNFVSSAQISGEIRLHAQPQTKTEVSIGLHFLPASSGACRHRDPMPRFASQIAFQLSAANG